MKKLTLTTILIIAMFLSITGCSSVDSKTSKNKTSVESIKEVQKKFSESKISSTIAWNEYLDYHPVPKENLAFTVIAGFSASYNISNESNDTLISFFTNEEKQQIAYSIKRQVFKDYLERKTSLNDLIKNIGDIPPEKASTLYSMLIVLNTIIK